MASLSVENQYELVFRKGMYQNLCYINNLPQGLISKVKFSVDDASLFGIVT